MNTMVMSVSYDMFVFDVHCVCTINPKEERREVLSRAIV